jgi:hypothetical protein
MYVFLEKHFKLRYNFVKVEVMNCELERRLNEIMNNWKHYK